MKTKQLSIKMKDLSQANTGELASIQPQIGFVFASALAFENDQFVKKLQASTPGTQWVGCSTAGEVSKLGVTDQTVIVTALHFDNPGAKFKVQVRKVGGAAGSRQAGAELARSLHAPDLRSIIVMSPGVDVNGSLLVKGITEVVGPNVIVTGGLAGDGGNFKKTYTLSPEGISSDHVVGVGWYGDAVKLQHGCMGGWDPFGKVRQVTRSQSNVVYEIDGKRALDIYKEYLGEHAKDLPASGLMFPFQLLSNEKAETGLIRTILAVDEQAGSLTFAGDLDQGSYVRLMHANTKGLVSGAKSAAQNAVVKGAAPASFAMIVSCVGRKLVMGANVDEEIEAIADIFGGGCSLAGFYSYGEISPFLADVGCQLHNQTMTISYLSEAS